MLLAGDERGHTQEGNNNAYCQDNELSWIDWAPAPEREALTDFVQRVIALRRAHPSFRRRNFFAGKPLGDASVKDVSWLKPDGTEMTPQDWNDGNARCLGKLISGLGISERGPRGQQLVDDDFLLLFNAHHDEIVFVLPPVAEGAWHLLLDTATQPMPALGSDALNAGAPPWPYANYPLQPRSFVLLSRTRQPA
jgi:glycogen operon protein